MKRSIAEVIVLPKPDKPPNEKSSYRLISLLPVICKLFEKLSSIVRLRPIIEQKQLIPTHHLDFAIKAQLLSMCIVPLM